MSDRIAPASLAAPPRGARVQVHPGAARNAGGSGHVPVLDGIRGLAILLVMLSHLTSYDGDHAVDTWFCYLVWWGWIGVDLFFVLSGYLITGILLDTRAGPAYFRNFYARRVLRIFPLYYALITLALVILPRVLPPAQAARFGRLGADEPYYWVYLQNFAMARVGHLRLGALDVTWSLAIEEQFYFVWPAVVFLCSRRTLARLSAGLFVVALTCRAFCFLGLHLSPYAIYMLTPCRMDALAAGALLAAMARGPGGLASLVPAARRIGLATGLGALSLVVVERVNGLVQPWEPGYGPFSIVVGFSLIALAFAALLLLVVEAPPTSLLHRTFASRGLRFFGVYAYGLYLLHVPIRPLVWSALYGPAYRSPSHAFLRIRGTELPGQLLFYPLALAAIVPFAWLSYHLYEKQFLKLKRHFAVPADARAVAVPTSQD